MGKLPRRDAILNLCETLAKVPPNLASLIVRPDGTVEATFQQTTPAAEVPRAPVAASAAKLVPGTIFPDDKSPIDAADLTLHPIDLGDEAN